MIVTSNLLNLASSSRPYELQLEISVLEQVSKVLFFVFGGNNDDDDDDDDVPGSDLQSLWDFVISNYSLCLLRAGS